MKIKCWLKSLFHLLLFFCCCWWNNFNLVCTQSKRFISAFTICCSTHFFNASFPQLCFKNVKYDLFRYIFAMLSKAVFALTKIFSTSLSCKEISCSAAVGMQCAVTVRRRVLSKTTQKRLIKLGINYTVFCLCWQSK